MAPIPSHHMASNEAYSTYMVILKVYGAAIRLFDQTLYNPIVRAPAYRVLCHDLEAARSDASLGSTGSSASGMQVFVLDKPADKTSSGFQNQSLFGQEMSSTDLVMFMSQKPIDSSRKASYALDIGVSRHRTSMEDLSGEDCKKIGTAYIYLEPKFSTQGVQRMQIMDINNRATVGQMQVEYLIVTNPLGFGAKVPLPQWLSHVVQLDAGHRGAGSGCRADLDGCPITENTVASFNFAARHGADMVELDVMCTADGVPIVYHNYNLESINEPAQIDELTLEELHHLRHLTIHDKNCKHKQTDKILDRNSLPFPTLEEVLRDVDKSCAMNIELKWAQMLPNGKSEAIQYREINDNVDRIMDCIYKHSNGRPILLSTLNADIAIMLRLKQTKYPVLFLTTGDSQRFMDPATKSVKTAIHLAQAFDMAGINPNAAKLNENLVRYAQDRGLLVYAWGKIESAQTVKELKRYGINGVIYDKIDLIKPQD